MAHHDTAHIQLLKGMPGLVQIVSEDPRLQAVHAVIHTALPVNELQVPGMTRSWAVELWLRLWS